MTTLLLIRHGETALNVARVLQPADTPLSARGLLQMFCSHAGTAGVQNVLLGGGPLFAISPEHAQILARDGFTKQDVRRYLYEHARAPLTEFSRENIAEVLARRRPRWCVPENPDARIPIADRPEDITILVVGGPGPHSQFLPSFGQTESVTRPTHPWTGCLCQRACGHQLVYHPHRRRGAQRRARRRRARL